MGGLIAQLVMGLVGSVVSGAASCYLIDQEISEYRQAREDIAKANKEYAGPEAYNRMLNQGKQTGEFMGRTADTTSAINTNPGGANVMSTAAQAADPTAGAVMGGYEQGMNNASAMMDAEYNKATKAAQGKMEQAGIKRAAGEQAASGLASGLSTLGSTMSQIGGKKGE